jgi:hypothetical protein
MDFDCWRRQKADSPNVKMRYSKQKPWKKDLLLPEELQPDVNQRIARPSQTIREIDIVKTAKPPKAAK